MLFRRCRREGGEEDGEGGRETKSRSKSLAKKERRVKGPRGGLGCGGPSSVA
ncbi:hypothetical protein E2C01_074714 [Portunus trituberculatus]|uniref:Uncharacterized protein n=1 Tax=Portunus trituberculatus TaxID=210409 RepID=A0A5B7ID62_PORTR|nr:hypothetical protein [Portunus trituberculatus]